MTLSRHYWYCCKFPNTFLYPLYIQENKVLEKILDSFWSFVDQVAQLLIFFAILVFYLIDIELALASGQFSVAGGELSDKIMTGRKIDLDRNRETRERETVNVHQQHNLLCFNKEW